MSGKGGIACTHPLSVGLFGRYARIANELIEASDCLLVVGCKLGEIATKRYALPPTLGPAHPSRHRRRGDRPLPPGRGGVVGRRPRRARRPRRRRWPTTRGRPARRAPITSPRSRGRMKAWARGRRAAPRFARAADPHGAAVHRTEPRAAGRTRSSSPMAALPGIGPGSSTTPRAAGRHFIPDRGFASIGYGLPGGIGAALAAPRRPVVAIGGDGGFNMTLGELETARRAGLGLTVVVVNNAASGYVKALQHAMMGGRYQSADLGEMDYAAIARAMGVGGIRVEDPEALGAGARRRAWPSATARPSSMSSSPATRPRCSRRSTTAPSRSSRATGSRDIPSIAAPLSGNPIHPRGACRFTQGKRGNRLSALGLVRSLEFQIIGPRAPGQRSAEAGLCCLAHKRRHCERSEAISMSGTSTGDCFVAALLAMTSTGLRSAAPLCTLSPMLALTNAAQDKNPLGTGEGASTARCPTVSPRCRRASPRDRRRSNPASSGCDRPRSASTETDSRSP